MLNYVLFVLFFFFTQKQLFAASHFTGSSQKVLSLLRFASIVNLIAEIAFLIFTIVDDSFLTALILFFVALIFTLIMNFVFSRITAVLLLRKDYYRDNEVAFSMVYDYKCNVTTTVIANIGLIVNLISIIVFFATLA